MPGGGDVRHVANDEVGANDAHLEPFFLQAQEVGDYDLSVAVTWNVIPSITWTDWPGTSDPSVRGGGPLR